jgi:hypothetical protein
MNGPHPTRKEPLPSLESALLEYLQAEDGGQPLEPAAWMARYPHLAGDLAVFLANLMNPVVEQLRNAVDEDLLASFAHEQLINSAANTGSPDQVPSETPTSEADTLVPLPVPIPPYGDSGYRVGEGGMGIVYRVRNPLEGRDIALKVMRPDLATRSPKARARFLREARAHSSIKHDNVVEIYHVGEVADVPYFTMPLLQGQTLAAYLREHQKKGTLPPLAEVLRIGREIAAGLAAAHEEGLVHRDVKPSNIWLDATAGGRVKVLDFGLARPLEEGSLLTETGHVLGTPPFMSPEQFTGASLDERSDLFSLGAILYQLTTGRAPFLGSTLARICHLVLHSHPPTPHTLNPEMPAALSDLIEQLLAKSPLDRPASASEVEQRLRAIEAGLGGAPTFRMPGRRRGRTSGRSVLLGVAACSLLLLVGGIGALSAGLGARSSVQARVPVADLDLTVWKVGHRHEPGRRLWGVGVLPLRPEDALRIEISVDRPAYLYLVWLGAGGKLTPLYPWTPDWQRPAVEEARLSLNLPELPDEAGRLKGDATGVEALLLLARNEPLPETTDFPGLLTAWRDQGNQLPDPARSAAWLVDGKPDRGDKDLKRADFAGSVKVFNLEGTLCAIQRSSLKPLGGQTRAVCFGFQAR